MYLKFYGLLKEPFHITPDPEFLYLSSSHKEALGSILYGIEKKKGFITVTGAVGTGKTTILRACIERLDRVHTRLLYIFNPALTFLDLLKAIFSELGRDAVSQDEPGLVSELHSLLIEEYEKGNNVVLIIDEAQNMPVETMESLRMLSNLETPKDKLLQIVMVGQPEFEEILNRSELRQLRQRVAMKSIIRALTPKESGGYIAHRMDRAGVQNTSVFTAGALKVILREAEGIPRVINILCDNALVSGYGYQKNPVSAAVAREIVRDYRGTSKVLTSRFPQLLGAISLAVFIGGLIYMLLVENIFGDAKGMKNPVPVAVDKVITKTPVHLEAGKGESKTVKADEPAKSDPAMPPKSGWISRRIVKKGDILSTLALEIYGRADKEVLDAVRRRNPSIVNPDIITVDAEIIFPEIDEKRTRKR